MKYFMMFAPIIWLWASINFAWILLASRKKTELCENEKQAPDGKKKRKKKRNQTFFFACRVSAPRLNHEMAYNAGREVPIPPLNPYNIIKAKRGEVSQSMVLYCGIHRGEVSLKLSRRGPINRPLLWILKSTIKVY